MKDRKNRAVMYKRFVFTHSVEQDVEIEGNLSIKVTLPTNRPDLIAAPLLEPEQLANIVLAALGNGMLSVRS